jgi:uncharacterized membrane protein
VRHSEGALAMLLFLVLDVLALGVAVYTAYNAVRSLP